MAYIKTSDEEFLRVCKEEPSATAVAKRLGVTERSVYYRRNTLEQKKRKIIPLDGRGLGLQRRFSKGQERLSISLPDGLIIVGSDAHYWPDLHSTAQRALVYLTSLLKPDVFVMNGDSFDGPTASRFGQINWEEQPKVAEELKAVQKHLSDIRNASKETECIHIWGNHDSRFDSFLALLPHHQVPVVYVLLFHIIFYLLKPWYLLYFKFSTSEKCFPF